MFLILHIKEIPELSTVPVKIKKIKILIRIFFSKYLYIRNFCNKTTLITIYFYIPDQHRPHRWHRHQLQIIERVKTGGKEVDIWNQKAREQLWKETRYVFFCNFSFYIFFIFAYSMLFDCRPFFLVFMLQIFPNWQES